MSNVVNGNGGFSHVDTSTQRYLNLNSASGDFGTVNAGVVSAGVITAPSAGTLKKVVLTNSAATATSAAGLVTKGTTTVFRFPANATLASAILEVTAQFASNSNLDIGNNSAVATSSTFFNGVPMTTSLAVGTSFSVTSLPISPFGSAGSSTTPVTVLKDDYVTFVGSSASATGNFDLTLYYYE